MSGTYTSDEKVEFALKTALFRTMQSKDQPTALEDPAPPRIFPNNIMKVNLIEKGEGDIDEDGYYVGRTDSASAYLNDNNLVDLEKAELVISNYRIIDPSNNVITSKRVSDLTTVNESQTSITAINALPTTGTDYPKKNWFFRGHYGSDSGTTAFNNASSSYDGLQLSWDKSTVGATPTEADIVPHLKFYLQVQTKYTNVAHGDNISYAHDLMKGLIGLDQGFTTTLKVNRGEGGSCATLGATGKAEGNFWFTQATSGTLSFYGVGENENELVNASDSLSNLNSTKFPMISYIRYTGETGFGAGTGGGGGSVTLASADSNVSNMIGGTAQTMTTTSFNFDGNVGIGTTSPTTLLEIKGDGDANNNQIIIQSESYNKGILFKYKSATGTTYDFNQARIWTTGISYDTKLHFSTAKNVPPSTTPPLNEAMTIDDVGNVGIGTTSPLAKLQIDMGYTGINGNPTANNAIDSNIDGLYITKQSELYPSGGSRWGLRIGVLHSSGRSYIQCSNDTTSTAYDLLLNPNGGNVGIGTTSPSSVVLANNRPILDIAGNGAYGTGRICFSDADSADNARNWFVGPYRSSDAQFQITPSTAKGGGTPDLNKTFCIEYSGNVGIGTTSPQRKLHIKGGAGINGDIRLEMNYGPGSGWGAYTDLNSIEFYAPDNGTPNTGKVAYRLTHQVYEANGNSLLVMKATEANGNTESNLMTWKHGNVGIGTRSPDHKLEIYESTGFVRLCMESSTTGKLLLGTNNDGRVFFWNEKNSYMHFGTNNTERMRIDSDGNVGIGRTDPTYKLDMYNNGSARLARFQTTGDVSIEISSTSPSSDYDDCGIVWHGHASAPWWHLGVTDNESRLCIGYQSNSSSTGWPDSSEKIYFASDGKVLAAGFTNYSDDRIKNNEKTVINALNVINKLQTKKYFKSTKMYSKEHNYILNDDGIPIKDESGNDITNEDYNIETGFIAQDVKKIPELAYSVFGEEMKYGKEYEIIYDESGNTIDDGTGRPKSKKVLGNYPKKLGVTYQDIFCYNVAATQELDRKVIALENENAELKTKVATLESELAAIKQHLGI